MSVLWLWSTMPKYAIIKLSQESVSPTIVMSRFNAMSWFTLYHHHFSLFCSGREMMTVVYKQWSRGLWDIESFTLIPCLIKTYIIQNFLKMEGNLTANSTLSSFGVLETLGLLFYVASPSRTSYQSIDECPDFVNQVQVTSFTRKLLSLSFRSFPTWLFWLSLRP